LVSQKCLPAALQGGPHADRQIIETTAYAQIDLSCERFRCQSGKPFLGKCCRTLFAGSQDVADTIREASPKNTAFDHEIEGRVQCFSSTSCQPPSVSSISLRLLRIQVKIGVSRSV